MSAVLLLRSSAAVVALLLISWALECVAQTQCSRGNFSSTGSTPCLACAKGKYQDNIGQTTCKLCPTGQVSSQTGSSECYRCDKGTFSNVSACLVCERGFFSNSTTGTSQCEACPDGQFTANETADPQNRESCSPCPANHRCTAGFKATDLTGEESSCTACINEARHLSDRVCVDFAVADTESAFYKCTCNTTRTGYYCDEDFLECASSPCRNGANCTEGEPFTGQFLCTCTPGWQGTLCDEAIDYCEGYDDRAALQHYGNVTCNELVLPEAEVAKCTSYTNLTTYRCTCPLGHFGVSQCQACAPGKYADKRGLCQCLDCESGMFTNKSGLSACFPCNEGHRCPRNNESQIECTPGWHQNETRQTSCRVCQRGYFMPDEVSSAAQCPSCAPGRFAHHEGQSVCQLCEPGHQCPTATDAQIQCRPGFFQPFSGRTSCQPCANGTFTTDYASTTCRGPMPGEYSDCPTEEDVLCARGWFQSLPNSTVCVRCAEGRFAAGVGLSVCSRCPLGSWCEDSGSPPQFCDPGFFAEHHDQTTCTECAPGHFVVESNASVCNKCPAGHRCPLVASLPIPCSRGMFQPLQEQTACHLCSVGFFENETASTECQPCYRAHRCAGSLLPEPCPPGRYQNSTQASECIICPRGRFNNESNQSMCTPCPPHTKCPYQGMLNWIECDEGTFFSAGENPNSYCSTCPDDGVARDGCFACPRGKYCSDPDHLLTSPAVDCGVGNYSETQGQTECDRCPKGKFQSSTGQSKCVDCTGTATSVLYSDELGLSVCKLCPSGSSCALAANSPELCEPGTAREADICKCPADSPDCSDGGQCKQRECVECEAGSFSGLGQDVCTTCGVGRYTDTDASGESQCKLCAVGMFKDWEGDGVCLLCELGTYQDRTGRSNCTRCAEQKYANVKGLSACLDCDSGKQCNDPTEGPQDCLAGFRATDGPCQRCKPGRYQDEIGKDECLPCEPGWFADNSATSICEACPFGYACPNASEAPVPCATGSFADELNSTACMPCPVGHQCKRADLSPVACARGTFANDTGLTYCYNCTSGYFAASSQSSECAMCDPGYFTSKSGHSICTACNKGYFAFNFAQSLCDECLPGSIADDNAFSVCTNCEIGKYSNASSLTVCTRCPRGFQCPDPAQSPMACPSGTFASGEQWSQCESCPVGRFNDGTARPGCKLCEEGFYCNTTHHMECPQGTYRNNVGVEDTGDPSCSTCGLTSTCSCSCVGEGITECDDKATACRDCEPGSFNNKTQQSVCSLCRPGYECNGSVALEVPCAYGKFATEEGHSECVACAPGRYSSGTGESQCRECTPGHFCAGQRLNFTQLPCPRGKHQSLHEQGRCTKCVVGRFEPDIGSNATECTPCGENTADDDDGEYKCACNENYFMYVDDADFYDQGFVLDSYSTAVRCFQEPTATMCSEIDSTVSIFENLDNCPFDDSYVCRLVLTLSESMDADPTIQRLDRLSKTLKDQSKASCLKCPEDGAECPAGTEFIDGRVHPNALLSSAGYWQDEDLYFDKGLNGVSTKTASECAISGSCDGTDWPAFENCFSESCSAGLWSDCADFNAGILCKTCVDNSFCVDGAGILNGNPNLDSSSLYAQQSAAYTYNSTGSYFCPSSTLLEVALDPQFKKTGYNCTLCEEPDDTVALRVGLGLGSVLLVLGVGSAVAYVTRKRWLTRFTVAMRTARSGKRRRSAKGQSSSKLFIVFSYLQVQAMLLRPDTLETDFQALEESMRWMKFSNLDITYAAGCSFRGNFALNFVIYTVSPVLIVGVLLAIYFALSKCMGNNKSEKYREAWPFVAAHLVSLLLLVVYVIYTPASRVVLQVFDCSEFSAEEPRTSTGQLYNGSFSTHEEFVQSSEYSGVQRLKAANYDMICWDSPRHQTLFYAGIVATLVYPVGIPIVLFVILYRSRKKLDDSCDVACAACNVAELDDPKSEFVPVFHTHHLKHELVASSEREYLKLGYHMPNAAFDNLEFLKFSVFVRPYFPNKWPFEIAVMLHKLFLCCLILFIPAGSPEQVATGMTEVVLFAGAMALWGPHTSKVETLLFCICQLSLFLTLLTAMFLKAEFDNADFLLDMLFYTTILPIFACGCALIWRPLISAIQTCCNTGKCDCCVRQKTKNRRKARREQAKASEDLLLRRRLQTYDEIVRSGGHRGSAVQGTAQAALEMVPLADEVDLYDTFDLELFDRPGGGSAIQDPASASDSDKAEEEPSHENDSDEESVVPGVPLIALYDFHETRDGATLITFSKGDPLVGMKTVHDGKWWIGYHVWDKLTVGLFPCNYVKKANETTAAFCKSQLREINRSSLSTRLSQNVLNIDVALPAKLSDEENDDIDGDGIAVAAELEMVASTDSMQQIERDVFDVGETTTPRAKAGSRKQKWKKKPTGKRNNRNRSDRSSNASLDATASWDDSPGQTLAHTSDDIVEASIIEPVDVDVAIQGDPPSQVDTQLIRNVPPTANAHSDRNKRRAELGRNRRRIHYSKASPSHPTTQQQTNGVPDAKNVESNADRTDMAPGSARTEVSIDAAVAATYGYSVPLQLKSGVGHRSRRSSFDNGEAAQPSENTHAQYSMNVDLDMDSQSPGRAIESSEPESPSKRVSPSRLKWKPKIRGDGSVVNKRTAEL